MHNSHRPLAGHARRLIRHPFAAGATVVAAALLVGCQPATENGSNGATGSTTGSTDEEDSAATADTVPLASIAGGEAALQPILPVEELERRAAQFAPVEITFDASLLDSSQKTVVRKLVEASQVLDQIFLRQVWPDNPEAESLLVRRQDTHDYAAALDYFRIMYGPWDRLEENEPFLNVGAKPPGAGYYPPALTREEFDAWIEAHPDDRVAFTSYYTLIRRSGDSLVAVPYSEAYEQELEAAAALLREAAEAATNESLRRYLETRAESFLTDDYYPSDVAWMRLEGNLIEPTIGPYEVYEDGLFGYKAAFESFITLKDPQASADLQRLVEYLPDLERALPIPDEHKYLERDFTSPISVVDQIYAAGDTRSGVQTIAFNLPNDPRVREEEGSKKVMLRNVIRAKFETILRPIAAAVLVPEQAERIAFEAYFTRVLMHELAHGLGPDYVTGRPEVTINKALEDRYSAIEEAKADAVGTHSLGVLADQGVYDAEFREEVYIDHVADMFRCVRFGVGEAHGLGCLTQFNYLVEHGAITHDPETGLFAADLAAMPDAMADLAAEYLMIEATGDYERAGAFVETYGSMSPEMQAALGRLEGEVPVDIRPIFPVEEMMAEW